ncbi:MAG TPA: RiPP maturation radical SAM C-methyltransferase [Pyrinomonadaceae bacterium]|nr:RiPP maturation radical SAM C-methyltransferase [Pyrinomonadaceae bacterium]
MSDQCVLLISMPWSSLARPSIQLGILGNVLRRSRIRTEVRSFNLAFMDHIASSGSPSAEAKRLSFENYVEVSERCYSVGLGDWIFAVPPFRNVENSDEEYLDCLRDYFPDSNVRQELFAGASRMRQLVPSFLEQCVDDVLAAQPRVVGFTTTFSQNVPSLVLAQLLKQREPSLHIVFGGSNCDGPMGEAIHRSFPWVDTVVRGEAERVLPEVVRDVFAGRKVRSQPGLCYRDGEHRFVVAQEGGDEVPMDEVPLPDYDEYFERLDESSSREEILPNVCIPFESARGCWWGAKLHCTFCGLNGSSMPFRSKSPGRVVEDVITLARKHRVLNFNAVDNIIDMSYFREVLPKLRDAGYDFSLFYETKSNLKKEQLRAMRDGGVLQIQPGIESLSTPILKLMKKGVTALQNIRLLKWCEEFGLEAGWSVLYGFPGEPVEEYDRMAEMMPSISHLEPPKNMASVDLQRFSPYHQRPHDYGLKITGPKPYYHLVYPCDEAALNDLAYSFNYTYDDGRQPHTYFATTKKSVEDWQENYPKSVLSYRQGPGFLIINDSRPGVGGYDHTLGETEARVYLACDAGATPRAVLKGLQADGDVEITLDDVEIFLDEMVDLKLMYEEDGLYLSLAVDSNFERTTRSNEGEDSLSVSSTLLKLSYKGIEV